MPTFQCLVMYISRDIIYYVHIRARYILLGHDSQAYSRMWRRMSRTDSFLHPQQRSQSPMLHGTVPQQRHILLKPLQHLIFRPDLPQRFDRRVVLPNPNQLPSASPSSFEPRNSTHNRHPFFFMARTRVQRAQGMDHLVHQPSCQLTGIRKARPENRIAHKIPADDIPTHTSSTNLNKLVSHATHSDLPAL